MLNGKHDPATGYTWALRLAAQLGRHATLVSYEGAGHTAYRRNDCTRGATHAYLFDLTAGPRHNLPGQRSRLETRHQPVRAGAELDRRPSGRSSSATAFTGTRTSTTTSSPRPRQRDSIRPRTVSSAIRAPGRPGRHGRLKKSGSCQ